MTEKCITLLTLTALVVSSNLRTSKEGIVNHWDTTDVKDADTRGRLKRGRWRGTLEGQAEQTWDLVM
jgi:hypothetical protein